MLLRRPLLRMPHTDKTRSTYRNLCLGAVLKNSKKPLVRHLFKQQQKQEESRDASVTKVKSVVVTNHGNSPNCNYYRWSQKTNIITDGSRFFYDLVLVFVRSPQLFLFYFRFSFLFRISSRSRFRKIRYNNFHSRSRFCYENSTARNAP